MAHCAGSESCGDAVRLAATVVPQVDHRVGECLERVVKSAETFEAQQQAAKLIFPAEQPLNGVEALFKNGRLEQRLAAAFGRFSCHAGSG